MIKSLFIINITVWMFFLLFGCSSETQNEIIKDKKHNNRPSTAKDWNDLSEFYREEEDTTNLIKSINEAYGLAIKNKDNQEIGRSFMYQGDYEYLRSFKFDSTYLNLKTKAIEYLKQHENSPYLTEAYYDLSRYYNVSGKYNIALEYLKLSLNTITEKNIRGSAPIYCNMAYSYLYLGKLDSLEFCAQKAITEAAIRKDTVSLCTGYSYLGILNSKRNNFTKAIDYHSKVSDIYQKQQNWKQQVTTLCNIAILYHRFEKYNKAIEIGEKALNIVNEYNLSNIDRSKVLLTIATPLYLNKQYTKAIEYYKQALPILIEQDHIRACLSGLAENYHHINMPDSSNYYYDQLEALYQNNNITQSSSYYNAKGRKAFFNKNYEEATYFWEKTIERRNKSVGFSLRETASFYNNLSFAYEKGSRNYKQALHYKNKALILQDSIFQDKYNNSLSEFYAQYQTVEKELEIAKLNEEKQKEEFQRILIISIGLFIIVLLFIAFLYNRIRRLKKEKEASALSIRIKEKDMEYQSAIARSELNTMQSYLNGLETERERLAKELHDNVANELLSIDFQLKSIKQVPEETSIQIENLHTEIRNISHELIPPLFKYASLPEIISDYVSKVNKNNISIDLQIEGYLEHISEKQALEIYRIIQEATSNIVKHAEATVAKISLVNSEGFVKLTIEDNGKGFDVNRKQAGIGLQIIKDRVAGLNGVFQIYSQPDGGCKIDINFPISQLSGDE